MMNLRFSGLLSLWILLYTTTAAIPIMEDVESTMSPLELSTTASVEEISLTTTQPIIEESDVTMAPALTTTIEEKPTPPTSSAPAGTVDIKMSTIAESTAPSSNITPVIAAVTNLFDVATTTLMMNNNNDMVGSATTTVTSPDTTTVTSPATTTTMAIVTLNEKINEMPKLLQETLTPTAPVTEKTSEILPAVTTAMAMMEKTTLVIETAPVTSSNIVITALNEDSNVKPLDEQLTNSLQPLAYQVSPSASAFAEATNMPSIDVIPTKLIDSLLPSQNDITNVFTTLSNEATSKMVSSTDAMVENIDKRMLPFSAETEPSKSQQTQTESDPKSGCNSITTSFVVLYMTVLYAIV